MDAIRPDVEKLVSKELQSANEKFGMFHSQHEGYAIILEEFEEAKDDLDVLEFDLNCSWNYIKCNVDDEELNRNLRDIKINAISLAVEAIQVAAMAQKFIDCFSSEV